MRPSRGFSLVEALIALLILTAVITTSLGIFYDRHRRLQAAEETVIAWQVLGNEAEMLRRVDFGAIGDADVFNSSAELLKRLDGATSSIRVERPKPGIKVARLRIEWKGRHAEVSVVRTDTGGGNLW